MKIPIENNGDYNIYIGVCLEILTCLAGSRVHHCQRLTFALLVLGCPKLTYILKCLSIRTAECFLLAAHADGSGLTCGVSSRSSAAQTFSTAPVESRPGPGLWVTQLPLVVSTFPATPALVTNKPGWTALQLPNIWAPLRMALFRASLTWSKALLPVKTTQALQMEWLGY